VIRVWVVPTYFTTPPTAHDRAALLQAVLDAKAFYADESLGRFRLAVPALRPNLKVVRGKGCDVSRATDAASKSLRKVMRQGDVVVTWTQSVACPYAGVGGGDAVWVQSQDDGVLVHELGHAIFGFGHDGRVDCKAAGAYVTASRTCTYDEYGNPYSVMGWGNIDAGLPAAELLSSGMRSQNQLLLATATGRYSLHRRASSSGTISLVVPWRGDLYYGLERLDLEYRSPVGRDKWISDPNQGFGARGGNGVLVYTEHSNKWTDGKAVGTFGLASCSCGLLNMHPAPRNDPDDGSYTPSLQTGESWTSPDKALTITVVTMTQDVAQVDITRAVDTQKPFPFQIYFSEQRSKGALRRVSLEWNTARAYWGYSSGDDWGIKSYLVRIDGTGARSLVRGPHAISDADSSLDVSLKPGVHRIVVTASDDAGNIRTVARSITVK
jgi:hypothetical protein